MTDVRAQNLSWEIPVKIDFLIEIMPCKLSKHTPLGNSVFLTQYDLPLKIRRKNGSFVEILKIYAVTVVLLTVKASQDKQLNLYKFHFFHKFWFLN